MSSERNVAVPATMTFAPAAAAVRTVSGFRPPSTSISTDGARFRSRATFGGRLLANIRDDAIRFEVGRQLGNVSAAARVLGVARSTVYDVLAKVDPPQDAARWCG